MSRSLYVEICTACCVGPRRKCFLVDAITFCTNCKWLCQSYSEKLPIYDRCVVGYEFFVQYESHETILDWFG